MQKQTSIVVQVSLGDFKARMSHEEAAQFLGMSPEELSIVVNAPRSRLKPLGNPVQNAPKLFAACQVISLGQDVEWLDEATEVVRKARLRKRERITAKPKAPKPILENPGSETPPA